MSTTVDFRDVNTSDVLSVERLESEVERKLYGATNLLTKEERGDLIYKESLVLNAYLLACCDHEEDFTMPGAQIRLVSTKSSGKRKRPIALGSLLKKGAAKNGKAQ